MTMMMMMTMMMNHLTPSVEGRTKFSETHFKSLQAGKVGGGGGGGGR